MTLLQLIEAGLFSILAGLFGSLLGLGGGLFVTPLLSGPLGVPIHRAVAASVVAVIATSSVGGGGYLRRDLPNVRLGMVLETGTVVGAIAGTLLGGALNARALAAIFAIVLIYGGIALLRPAGARAVRADPLAVRLGICERYPVGHLGLGLGVAVLAGVVSGLLGVGGGLVLVPVMVAWMGVPLPVATATSTFMIGITGVASAAIQVGRGMVDPVLVTPVILGIYAGASLGPWLAPRVPQWALRAMLLAAIGISTLEMAQRAAGA